MEFVSDNVTVLEVWNVASSQLMEFVVVKMLVGGTADVQVRDPCTLTIITIIKL